MVLLALRLPLPAQVANPAQVQVNLGYVPFDVYNDTTPNNQGGPAPGGYWVAGCGLSTVRACYQNALANYYNQGVRGVRFQRRSNPRYAGGATEESASQIPEPSSAAPSTSSSPISSSFQKPRCLSLRSFNCVLSGYMSGAIAVPRAAHASPYRNRAGFSVHACNRPISCNSGAENPSG